MSKRSGGKKRRSGDGDLRRARMAERAEAWRVQQPFPKRPRGKSRWRPA